MLERVITYFGKEGYDVPGSESSERGKKSGLTDWEMMFLVRSLTISNSKLIEVPSREKGSLGSSSVRPSSP